MSHKTNLYSPSWLLDEITSAGRENFDEDHVNNFTIEDVEYSPDGLFAKYIARAT